MEQKKQGGKRLGAGRKPIGDKKNPYTFYVEYKKVLPFGGAEKFKNAVYDFIDKAGQVVVLPESTVIAMQGLPSNSFQDLTKPNVEIKPIEQPTTNYEVKIPPKPENVPMGNYEGLKREILATNERKGLAAVMDKVKVALLNGFQKRELDAIAKEPSREFFND